MKKNPFVSNLQRHDDEGNSDSYSESDELPNNYVSSVPQRQDIIELS